MHLDVHSHNSVLEGPKRRKRAFDSAFNRYLASEHAYRAYNYSNPIEREWVEKHYKTSDGIKLNETIALNQLWEKYKHHYDDPKVENDYDRMKLIWDQFKRHYKVDEMKPLIKLIRTRRASNTVKVTPKAKNNTVTTATVATTPQKPVLETTPKPSQHKDKTPKPRPKVKKREEKLVPPVIDCSGVKTLQAINVAAEPSCDFTHEPINTVDGKAVGTQFDCVRNRSNSLHGEKDSKLVYFLLFRSEDLEN